MGNHEINQALLSHLRTMTGLPALIEENMKPSEPSDMYIQANLLPVSSTRIDSCGSIQKTGMIQFGVVGGRDKGTRQAMQLSDRIAQHFRNFQNLDLTILDCVAERAVTTDTQYMIPVTINYTYME